ncbi:MAG TPA: sulfatase [Candidatus Polarisedimenticolia bacterium]|nr:sulfatase [Candidatus Polarisedimenticolia bacterium]
MPLRGLGAPTRRLLLAAAALLGALACAKPPPPASLLLVTIDTLRADHLEIYGYSRPTSPRIDSLARAGTTFRNAYTPVPRTTQSVATILTGLYPKHHRARGLFSILPAANTTLAEILGKRGYATAAVVSNIFLQPGKGFEQGFGSYSNPRRRFEGDSSREITDEALAKLRSFPAGKEFFLWVHYLEPHWPYEPETRFAAMFGPPRPPSKTLQALQEGKLPKGDVIFKTPFSAEDRRFLVALYDGEIAQVDEQVGRLVEGIPAEIRKNLLIVLTSDHGESLGEHGYCFAHGEYLYDGTLRVPLIFVFPDRVPAGVQDRAASLLDVTPTILRLLGLPDRPGMDGLPLFAAGNPAFTPAGGHDLLFAETDYQLIHSANPRFYIPGVRGRWSSARRGARKLIRIPRPEGDLHELYDLSRDPGEQASADAAADPAGAELMRDLDRWVDYDEGAGKSLEESLTPEQRERLRSLGYLQ